MEQSTYTHNRKRSQASLELSTVISFVLVVFMVIMVVVLQKQQEAYETQVFMDAKRVASSLANNINTIAQNGNGYYRYINMPAELHGGIEYEIELGDNLVWISYAGETWGAPIITADATLVHLEKGGEICISNINGSIIVNDICNASDKGCGSVISCDPGDTDTCSSCAPSGVAQIHQNSQSSCDFYGCSTDEWHLYQIVPERDGTLIVRFNGTGSMGGNRRTDMAFYDYTHSGCASPQHIWNMEPGATYNFSVAGGDTYIIGLDVDSDNCRFNGTYTLKTELI